MNIYFVCTGNTCRSPMAEAILRSKLNKNIHVRSGGVYAQNGMPISKHAQTLIERANMPFTPLSRAISMEDIEWADIILTMTSSHKQAILQSISLKDTEIHTLKGFLNPEEDEDVHDPFGGDLATYEYTFRELTQLIEAIERKLMEGKK
ncbi:low molecular weight protein arginine phosphatase [Sporosarcina sp. CAU 1771]